MNTNCKDWNLEECTPQNGNYVPLKGAFLSFKIPQHVKLYKGSPKLLMSLRTWQKGMYFSGEK